MNDESQTGIALDLSAGYRSDLGLGLRLCGAFGFPQIDNSASPGPPAEFSYLGLGAEASYLWRDKLEPFIRYMPYNHLSQDTTSRLGTATVHTDLSYQGQSYGIGARWYVVRHPGLGTQIGLKFGYTIESYSRVSVGSRLEPLAGQTPPAFQAASSDRQGSEILRGSTYQVGMFIGI